MIDSLLRALYPSAANTNPFGSTNVNQLLASIFGDMGAQAGTPYGMFGDFYSQAPSASADSVLKQFAPQKPVNPWGQ